MFTSAVHLLAITMLVIDCIQYCNLFATAVVLLLDVKISVSKKRMTKPVLGALSEMV